MGHSQLEMRHVQVGDRVLGMNGKYTPVYAFGHQAPHLTERYVRIFTNATGSSASTTPLELSDRHFLYLHKHQEFPVLPADLKKGDVLLGAAGEPLKIVKIEYNVMGHGVFAPLTADGTIVVNGVVTSNYAFVLLTHPDEPSDYIYWDNWLWRGAAAAGSGGDAEKNRKFKFMTQHGFMHMTCSPLRIVALGISPWFGTLSNHEGMNYLSCGYLQAYTWWKQLPSSGTSKTATLGGIVKSRLLSAFGFFAWYFMFGIAWISYAVECMVGPSMSPTVLIGLIVMMTATFHMKNKQKQKRKRMTAWDLKLKAT